jgi:hypothetical protein
MIECGVYPRRSSSLKYGCGGHRAQVQHVGEGKTEMDVMQVVYHPNVARLHEVMATQSRM